MTSFGKSQSAQKQGALAGTGLTQQTQRLLEASMKQRGLSMRAMQDVAQHVQSEAARESKARQARASGGSTAWVDALVNRTSAYTPPASKAKPTVRVPSFKKGPARGPLIPAVPGSFSGKRMACQIPAPERNQWVSGAPAPNRDELKDHLAQTMEFGGAKALREHQAQMRAAAEEAAKAYEHARPTDVREALIDQLVDEISERSEFLETMRKAGRHKEYDAQIRAEINQRMNRLKGMGIDVSAGAPTQPRVTSLAPWAKSGGNRQQRAPAGHVQLQVTRAGSGDRDSSSD